ncbi:MAG: transposase, partial [Acidimicrobiia bacterium]|nr:transposase [Acidimicrobiia bacterium]
TKAFATGLRARNIGFAVVARSQTAVTAAITAANEDPGRWQPAVDQHDNQAKVTNGGLQAAVCDVLDLVDLTGWPEGTRLVIRRQPDHPGAQTTLLPDLEYRFWGHYTDQDGDAVELDRLMRAHAHVEDHIERLKNTGLERFPFTDWEANQAWLQTVMWAADLVAWFQLLCLVGPLARAKPRRLRWTLWHAPARIITTARRDIVRILDGWPTANDIVAAYQAIAALT